MIGINKGNWEEEWVNLCNSFKNDEKLFHKKYILGDFQLAKFLNKLKEQELIEKRNLENSKNTYKESINEIKSLMEFESNNDSNKNNIIKLKLLKLHKFMDKTKKEYKNIYEKLLQEEISLSMELNEFEDKFSVMNNKDDHEKEINLINTNHNLVFKTEFKEPTKDNCLDECHKQKSFIEITISNICNNKIISKSDFPEEELFENISNLKDVNYVKEKISDIDDFINVNMKGINLSWDKKDHDEFIKVVSMFNGKINSIEFFVSLEESLPYISVKELKNHIKMYTIYIFLRDIKKLLLNQIKEIKSNEKCHEKVMKKVELIHEINSNQVKCINNKENQIKKEQVKNWKEIKVNEKRQEEENLKNEQKLKNLKEKKRLENIIKENRKKLEIANEKKLAEQELEQFEKEHKDQINKPQISKFDLERIKEKNEKIIEKRLELLKRPKSQDRAILKLESNYMKFVEKRKEELKNISSNVSQATLISNLKKKEKFDNKKHQVKDCCTMANNLLFKTALKTPDWRKNLV